ncbi:hypothetical protein Q0O85_18905 [Priestia megaterium]|uniref:N-acyl amino acid synthase FeeM domain-containing protein n=1 Tax=Priestia megaterium TaxID=1404 RepID=UPI00345A2AD7
MFGKVNSVAENNMYLEIFGDAWEFNDTDYENSRTDRYIMFNEEGEVFGAFAYTKYDTEIGSTIESLYSFKEKVKKINDTGKITIEITAFAIKKKFQSPKYFMQSFFYMTQELINLNADYCIALTEPKLSSLLKRVYKKHLSILERKIMANEDNTEWISMILDLKPVINDINQYPLLKYGTFNDMQHT